ncbi:MAG: haloacid dehalogenase superfamily, subfamily IA, variant 3 with third motif having DD or ED [Candidatus Nitrotoga sp. SPKER]|nr:MAG: haloacid dehalogenase superfamily, subfamily IA, variant 3 with third motif having DD or ED [Candidatus Nitrotoga sp. SPKER]
MKTKAIIFDVDGTLADTEEAHRLSFNKTFAENHLDWNWDVALYDQLLKVTGGKERINHFINTYVPDFKKPADYEGFVKNLHLAKTAHYTAMLREGGIPLRPNIKRLITEAKQAGLKLAIATTTSLDNVVTLLQQGLGADSVALFDVIGYGDLVMHKKPAPDIYFWVLERLGIDAKDCIALEDSENGLRSGLAAGIKTFITINNYTNKHDFSGASAVLDDLSDLENFYQLAGLDFSKQAVSA